MLQPGASIGGRFTILSLVGRGGMGTVYCARDERLGREVAIKLLRPDLAADPGARARFLREGHIAAQIVHPNVVRTYDAGDDPAGAYLVQEFVTGRTLDEVMPLPPEQAAKIIRAIATALGHIHSRGYIHCDVKPQNILLRDNGTPVLLDFGIARAEGADTTSLIATPHYLAPERAKGEPPSAASDLYALGIVLYQAVAGQPPFDAPNVHAIIQQHIETPVPPLPVASNAARVLDQVIARLTAKRPEDRYASIGTLQQELASVEGNAIHAQPTIHMAPPMPVQPAPHLASRPQPNALVAAWSAAPAMLSSLIAGWSAAPGWRRRRWIASIVIPLLLLLLVYGIARARTAPGDGVAAPAETAIPQTNAPGAVQVPAVVGLQYGAAEHLLAQSGLAATRGDERPASEAAGIVIQSDPPPAAEIGQGGIVVLHVSAGPEPTVAPAEPPPAVEPPADAGASPGDQGPPPENQQDEGRGQNEQGDDKEDKEDKEDKNDKKNDD